MIRHRDAIPALNVIAARGKPARGKSVPRKPGRNISPADLKAQKQLRRAEKLVLKTQRGELPQSVFREFVAAVAERRDPKGRNTGLPPYKGIDTKALLGLFPQAAQRKWKRIHNRLLMSGPEQTPNAFERILEEIQRLREAQERMEKKLEERNKQSPDESLNAEKPKRGRHENTQRKAEIARILALPGVRNLKGEELEAEVKRELGLPESAQLSERTIRNSAKEHHAKKCP